MQLLCGAPRESLSCRMFHAVGFCCKLQGELLNPFADGELCPCLSYLRHGLGGLSVEITEIVDGITPIDEFVAFHRLPKMGQECV